MIQHAIVDETIIIEGTDDKDIVAKVEQTNVNEVDMRTEEDLVGVGQVTYIQPDPEPEDDSENITLSIETEELNKEACTLDTIQLKKEVIEAEQDDTDDNVFILDDSQGKV